MKEHLGTVWSPHRRGVVRAIGGLVLGAAGSLPEMVTARSLIEHRKLSCGVNLSHWFAQSLNGYGINHLNTFVVLDDLRKLAQAGFTHVRLGIEPDALFSLVDGEPRFVEPVLSQLRLALESISRAGLAVVLDMHPVGASKNTLLTQGGAEIFVSQWSKLAGALGTPTPSGVFFEILNEPEPLAGTAWWSLQANALAAIRKAGAQGPVIANGGGWSGIDDLVSQKPYDDENVIYTVHCYAPLLFTHQATTWSWDIAQTISGLGWPLAPDKAEEATAAATSDVRARGFLQGQIADGSFTVDALDMQYDRLADWSRSHGGVPIYVGEFGVYAKAAPVHARLAWIQASRYAYAKRGWGWALWDNSASFGFRAVGSDRHTIDPAMLRALGVHPS